MHRFTRSSPPELFSIWTEPHSGGFCMHQGLKILPSAQLFKTMLRLSVLEFLVWGFRAEGFVFYSEPLP